MIIRARTAVTMDGPPIENGAVAISGNQIIDVGNFPEVSARHPGKKIVDLGEKALLPGLINAHCHLDYTCLRGKILPHDHRKSYRVSRIDFADPSSRSNLVVCGADRCAFARTCE